jgi:UPF0716 protein FxsA
MSFKWIIIAILALPVAELVAYLLVASQIGFLQAFLLQVVCSAAGFLVLRRSGKPGWARWKAGLATDTISRLEAHGSVVLAGILLVIPGFITDLAGVILLVPPLRRWFGGLIRGVAARSGATRRSDAVIDLAPDQWHEVETRKRSRKTTRKRRT